MTMVLMGVAGSGKTTIGTLLSARLGWKFVDGDQLHSQENVAKMTRGIPLTDEDRRPWLEAIRRVIEQHELRGENLILACSALKEGYRKLLMAGGQITWVYLKASPELVRERLESRQHHFMKADMLASQFRDLEEPGEGVIVINAEDTPEEIVEQIERQVRWTRED